MSGFLVFDHLSQLHDAAGCFGPLLDWRKHSRAHYPEIATREAALVQAATDFGTVPGHLILSYGEAMERVRELVQKRRTKATYRQQHLTRTR